MIYLDTSAAIKLVRPERHSIELSRWLRERREEPVLSSVLIEVELMRATWRSAPERIADAVQVLRGVGTIAISPEVVSRAAGYTEPEMRSLDAIHLASAEHLVFSSRQALGAFIAYDSRLLEAALRAGLPALAPGMG